MKQEKWNGVKTHGEKGLRGRHGHKDEIPRVVSQIRRRRCLTSPRVGGHAFNERASSHLTAALFVAHSCVDEEKTSRRLTSRMVEEDRHGGRDVVKEKEKRNWNE